jgi:glucosylglycerate synthase
MKMSKINFTSVKKTKKQKNNKAAKKPLIIFAIPSYNEAENIGKLTRSIDEGLCHYFKNSQAFIVNTDNDSADGTKKIFLNTKTRHKKIYLTSRGQPKNIRGKGFHMKMALELAKKMDADAIGFIDGDVSSAKPEWTKELVYPLLNGYDTVLPVYLRNEYDGSITNHLIHPILYGLILTDVRQPIAGEIGLSRRAINLLLSEKWHASANHFGVDVYFLTQSIFHGLSICQTFIGAKDHKPSVPKLDLMFIEVADSLIRQLIKYRYLWGKNNWQGVKIATLKQAKASFLRAPRLAFNYKEMKEELLQDYKLINPEIIRFFGNPLGKKLVCSFQEKIKMPKKLWATAVYKVISKNRKLNKKEFLAFRTVFFARFLTFYKEVIEKTYQESEKEIIKQAKTFKKMRKLALK